MGLGPSRAKLRPAEWVESKEDKLEIYMKVNIKSKRPQTLFFLCTEFLSESLDPKNFSYEPKE